MRLNQRVALHELWYIFSHVALERVLSDQVAVLLESICGEYFRVYGRRQWFVGREASTVAGATAHAWATRDAELGALWNMNHFERSCLTRRAYVRWSKSIRSLWSKVVYSVFLFRNVLIGALFTLVSFSKILPSADQLSLAGIWFV